MEIIKLKDDQAQLKNDGQLQILFLGTGGAFAKTLYQTNFIVIKGNDHLQVDCGTKSTFSTKEIGLKVSDIKNYYITHSHADHIGGLEEVGLIGRYISPNKPKLYITEEYEDILWNYSLRGGLQFSEDHDGQNLELSDFFNPVRLKKLDGYPRDTYEFNEGDINIISMRTKHIPEQAPTWKESFWSCGVIVDRRVMFTCDTRYDPELIIDYNERFPLEAIFHDVQFFKGGVHAALSEVSELPEEIKKKTYLVHYGDTWRKHEENIHEAGFVDFARNKQYYSFE